MHAALLHPRTATMATASLHCTPCLGRDLTDTALTASNCSSSSAATTASANCHRRSSGLQRTFRSGLGRRGAGGERCPSASPLRGSFDSPWHRRNSHALLRGCDWGQASAPRASPVEAMESVQALNPLPAKPRKGKLLGEVEMLEAFEIESTVRDYELDHYGVVNHAIYLQYCQHARHELFENVGFSPAAVTRSGNSWTISDMTLKFMSPLRSGDRYVVSSRISGTTAVRLLFDDVIYKLPDRQAVMSAKATIVFLDHNFRPTRISDDAKLKLLSYKSRVNSTTTVQATPGSKGHTDGQLKNCDAVGNSNDQFDGSLANSYLNGSLATDYINGVSVKGHINGC